MTKSPDTKRARTENEVAKDTTMANAHSDVQPNAVYDASTSSSLALYKSNHAASVRDISTYWSDLARSKLDWFAPFPAGVTGSFQEGSVSWFAGGKLNVCYNAVDRYCLPPFNRGDETAIIWEGDETSSVKNITYHELQLSVCRIANALKASGVQKGDVVTLYMPMVPELCMTMLACARIGAVHSVIFAGKFCLLVFNFISFLFVHQLILLLFSFCHVIIQDSALTQSPIESTMPNPNGLSPPAPVPAEEETSH